MDRRTRHAGHCWRSKDEIVSDVLQWAPAYGQSKAGRPARTYIQQRCDDTGCNPEDLPEAMNDRETWREWVRDIRASRTTWWWVDKGFLKPNSVYAIKALFPSLVFFKYCFELTEVYFHLGAFFEYSQIIIIIVIPFWLFHISVSHWFFTGVWVTPSLQDSSQPI